MGETHAEIEAREMVEMLLKYDPEVGAEIQRLRDQGVSWEEIGAIAKRAADRIARLY